MDWEFLVMTFRLYNSPASFQRLMNRIFVDEVDSNVLAFLDNVFIYSPLGDEH